MYTHIHMQAHVCRGQLEVSSLLLSCGFTPSETPAKEDQQQVRPSLDHLIDTLKSRLPSPPPAALNGLLISTLKSAMVNFSHQLDRVWDHNRTSLWAGWEGGRACQD